VILTGTILVTVFVLALAVYGRVRARLALKKSLESIEKGRP
jgi:hypothetical protein